MSKVKAIMCDLDGTLCNIDHRRHLVEGKEKDWDKFFDLMSEDTVNKWCIKILEAMEDKGYEIVFVTGRPQKYHAETKRWMRKNTPFRALCGMRKNGDYRKDSVIKAEMYENDIKPIFDVLFVIDDRGQCVDMWREKGLVCLQCDNLEN